MITVEKINDILTKEMPYEKEQEKPDQPGTFFKGIVWDGLIEVEDDFYNQCQAYLKSLEKSLRTNKNPRERMFIEDELKNARMQFNGLVDRRLAKVIDYAAIVAAGANGDKIEINQDHMTKEELEAYKNIIDVLKNTRQKIMGGYHGQ
jgi:DNA replication initiation complex subunit (GINS family)